MWHFNIITMTNTSELGSFFFFAHKLSIVLFVCNCLYKIIVSTEISVCFRSN